MPSKTKTTAAAGTAATPHFSVELLEQLIPGPVTPAELEGIFQQFKKSVLERALGAEMSHHLGYASGQAKCPGQVISHTPIGCLIADCCSKALGGKLPSVECSRTLL